MAENKGTVKRNTGSKSSGSHKGGEASRSGTSRGAASKGSTSRSGVSGNGAAKRPASAKSGGSASRSTGTRGTAQSRPQQRPAAKQPQKQPAAESGLPRPQAESTQAKEEPKKLTPSERMLADIKRKRQSKAVVLFAFGILLTAIVLIPGLSHPLHEAVCGIIGGTLCGLLWCALIFYISVLMALDKPESNIKVKISQAVGIIVLVCVFIYCVAYAKDLNGDKNIINPLWSRGASGKGPGLICGLIGWFLSKNLGVPFTILLCLLCGFVLAMLLTRTGLIQLFKSVSTPVKTVSKRAGEAAAYMRAERSAVRSRQIVTEDGEIVSVPGRELKPKPGSAEDVEYIGCDIVESVGNTAAGRRRRASFNIDVPVGDDEPFENSDASFAGSGDSVRFDKLDLSDISRPMTDKERKAEIIKEAMAPLEDETAGEESGKITPETAVPEDDSALERIAQNALEKLPKKQAKAAEIKAEAEKLEREIKQAEKPVNEYVYPSVELLQKPDVSVNNATTAELTETAKKLVETLQEYHVDATVSDMSRGPAVTRYEVTPAAGVRINKIVTLTDDIALRLAASAVRIEAPIPGKSAVGVEIPNRMRSVVSVRELIDSDQFRTAKSPITVCLGKDIEGNIILTDLAKMPHLLIAGSTGMGKSVCINSILVSLLYKSSPEDVRLIMVDPKAVELDVYNGIPHLLVPVVCDPKKAAGALQWAVTEMLKRYALLKEHSVRNLDGYNRIAEKSEDMEKLPRIVIIIDELADLMTASPKEVEDSIARLAAMARAAGMHIIIATQRPSVDVITGTIKNNIPSRIAFTVSSQIDSRTILGEGGAEKLIGKGDMLFNPVGAAKPTRIQGCFVDDDEVERIVEFVKSNSSAAYDDDIAAQIERIAAENADGGSKSSQNSDDNDMSSEDPLFVKAIDVVIECGQASTSMLQRRLGVGYARAGRLIDQLAERGIIGPYAGSKPREVLMSRQQFLEMTMSREDYAEVVDIPGITPSEASGMAAVTRISAPVQAQPAAPAESCTAQNPELPDVPTADDGAMTKEDLDFLMGSGSDDDDDEDDPF